jgi:hypothetical protein
MRNIVLLCAIVVLTGCGGSPDQSGKVGPLNDDSPIIVSDSSPQTKVKHHGLHDFNFMNGVPTVAKNITTLYCMGKFDCAGQSYPLDLGTGTPPPGWTLTVSSPSGQTVILKSTDNATTTVAFGSAIAYSPSPDPSDTKGTALTADYQISTATLATGTGKTYPMTCPKDKHCRIEIK